MDILKRNLAPISDAAWQEIDNRAKDVLKATLTARKVVSVNGPKGWDYTVISEGRLEVGEESSEGVRTGVYKVKPLVEARKAFELNKWELDNLSRGAKDLDLDALEDAVKSLALFEEEAIYNGFSQADIIGLKAYAKEARSLGEGSEEILESLSEAILKLKEVYAEKPYTLIVGKGVFKKLNKLYNGALLLDVVKELIGGDVIYSEAIEGAFLLPFNHEDIELTVGQDFSIGYESHDSKTVKFFITESFTFRVLDEKLIIYFENK